MKSPTAESGCLPECAVLEYDIERGQHHDAEQSAYFYDSGEANKSFSYSVLFGLSAEKAVVEEYPVYDVNRLVGNVGGALGLFVGVSFFSVGEALVARAARLLRRI